MEFNIQHPIRISVRETLRNPKQYDCIVIGIPGTSANATSSTQLGWFFRQLDAKHSGILSKRLEGTKIQPTASEVSFSSSRKKGKAKVQPTVSAVPTSAPGIWGMNLRQQQEPEEDWGEVIKLWNVSLNGSVNFQRLVTCWIKGDLAKDTRAQARAIGRKLASKMKTDSEILAQNWALLRIIQVHRRRRQQQQRKQFLTKPGNRLRKGNSLLLESS